MEKSVIERYDAGTLTKDSLNEIMEPFKNRDVDSGGSEILKSHDGLDAQEIIVKTMEPERYSEIPVADDCGGPKKGCYGVRRCDALTSGKLNCGIQDLWYEITRREWGFW
jgi:hypothetical protein